MTCSLDLTAPPASPVRPSTRVSLTKAIASVPRSIVLLRNVFAPPATTNGSAAQLNTPPSATRARTVQDEATPSAS